MQVPLHPWWSLLGIIFLFPCLDSWGWIHKTNNLQSSWFHVGDKIRRSSQISPFEPCQDAATIFIAKQFQQYHTTRRRWNCWRQLVRFFPIKMTIAHEIIIWMINFAMPMKERIVMDSMAIRLLKYITWPIVVAISKHFRNYCIYISQSSLVFLFYYDLTCSEPASAYSRKFSSRAPAQSSVIQRTTSHTFLVSSSRMISNFVFVLSSTCLITMLPSVRPYVHESGDFEAPLIMTTWRRRIHWRSTPTLTSGYT